MIALPFFLAATISFLCDVAYAPFPAGHPMNFANPVIEPVWDKLSDETQAEAYDGWIRVEPLEKAWFTHFDAWDRRAQADARAWEAGKDLLKAKAKELKDALAGNYLTPDFYDVTEEPEDPKKNKTRTEVKYVGRTQLKWEGFQTAFQHAMYLRLAEKRAMYQKVLESARFQGRKNKASQRNMKMQVLGLKEKLEEKYLLKLDKVKDKVYEIWQKAQEVKGAAKEEVAFMKDLNLLFK